MRDPDEATDGPTDPRVHPEQSPGFGVDPEGLDELDVGRDVTLGEATPRELTAADTAPIDDESTAEKLRLLAGGDPVERRRATLALAGVERSDAVVSALVTAGLHDEDDDVRQFAAEALGKQGGDRAADAVLAIADDDDPWVRAEAVVAMDRLDRGAFADRLEAALDDDHHAVRRNAAISLFKLRGASPDVLDLLLAQTDDPSDRVREWAAHLLAAFEDDRARSALTDLAEDESQPDVVRQTAVRALKADPGAFRRQFSGALDERERTLPGEDTLNRRPDL